jgi:uncharacterized transporter YbjL
LTDWADDETRGREMGLFDFVNLVGWGAGFAVGLVLTDVLSASLSIGFLVSAFSALAGLALAWATVHEPYPPSAADTPASRTWPA